MNTIDEVGQRLEFRYISLVFERGQAEIEVNKLTERLMEAVERYNIAKAEEEKARNDVNLYYGEVKLK